MHKIVFLLASLLIISSASAMSYDVINVNSRVYPGENLAYRINITNDGSSQEKLYINKFLVENTFGMAMSVLPSINLVLNAGESTMINISIPVASDTVKGTYRTPLLISYGNTSARVYLESVILSRVVEPVELQNITVINPEAIIPVDEFNITITLLCNVESVFPIVNVIVYNDNGIIFESSSVQSLKSGINVFRRSIKLPDRTLAGTYTVLVNSELSGRVVAQGAAD